MKTVRPNPSLTVLAESQDEVAAPPSPDPVPSPGDEQPLPRIATWSVEEGGASLTFTIVHSGFAAPSKACLSPSWVVTSRSRLERFPFTLAVG